MEDGGNVKTNFGAVLGHNTGSDGTATISGSGSTLDAVYIVVGNAGDGTLTIQDGGYVKSGSPFAMQIGRDADGSGIVTVSGNGSKLIAQSALYVADGGTGTLNILDGGYTKVSQNIILARGSSGEGAVTVSGSGSVLLGGVGLRVGEAGEGTFAVLDGAGAEFASAITLGGEAGGSGTVTVTGDGSRLRSGNFISVGAEGDGKLYVLDGGYARSDVGFEVGASAGATGEATISGTSAELSVQEDMSVGVDGTGTLNVFNGGYASSVGTIFIGANYGSNGTITVSGAQSRLRSAKSISVGSSGEGTLKVLNGGSVIVTDGVYIAEDYDSTGTVTISGLGSTLKTSEGLMAGFFGNGILNIEAGAYAKVGNFVAAYGGASTGTATVTGNGSQLFVEGDLTVGQNGEGEFSILDGGYVRTSRLFVGYKDDSSGTVTISGPGSKLKVEGDVNLGSVLYASESTLTVSNGGAVEAENGFDVAVGAASIGTLNIGGASGEDAQGAGFLRGADGGAATIEFGDGDGTLVFNHTDADYDFDADVSGSFALKHEAGNTHLTGDWSGFGGIGDISGGVLSVDTLFNGSMMVLSGGALAGRGTIEGDAEFQEGSFFQYDIASSDTLDVTENATIYDGANVVLVANGPVAVPVGTSTTILTGGTLLGAFDGLEEDLLFLDGTLSYTANSVDLTLDRNDVAFSDFTDTPTQAAIANAVDSLGSGNAVFDNFLVLSSKDEVINAVVQLSGEAHASTQSSVTQSSGMTRDMITSRIRSAFSIGDTTDASSGSAVSNYAPLGYAEEAGDTSAFDTVMTGSTGFIGGYEYWGEAYGALGKTLGRGESNTTERSTGGLMTGFETGYGSDWRLGAFLGYGHTQTNVDALHSETGMDSFTAGAYVGRSLGALRLQYGAAASIHDISSERDVTFAGLDETLKANYNAATLQAFGEVGYALPSYNGFALEPFAGAALVYQHTDGFTETGGDAALTGSSSSSTLAITTVGARSAFDLGRLSGGTTVSLEGSVAWNHTFGEIAPTTTMAFAAGGTPFTIAGNAPARDVGLVNLGVNFAVKSDIAISLDYTGAFGKDQHDHALSAKLKARF